VASLTECGYKARLAAVWRLFGNCLAAHKRAWHPFVQFSRWRSPNLHAGRRIIKYVCALRATKSLKGRIWPTDHVPSLMGYAAAGRICVVCGFYHM
jgi:hypothetical protein